MDQSQALNVVVKAIDEATATLKRVQNEVNRTASSVDDASKQSSSSLTGLQKTTSGVGKVFDTVMSGIQTGVQVAAVAIGTVLTASLSGAISRVDTLNNASRVFADMGFSVDQVTKSTDALKQSILGLPTALNEGIANVQQLAASTGNLDIAQKLFSAINDAVLGFGGNTNDVNSAVMQLSQDLSRGNITAATFNSMLNAQMGPALAAVAKQMGITAGALKDGLSDGSISITTFENALISLDQNGGGGLVSLHQIALESTQGISTSFANMRTAIVRGMADIIQAVGAPQIAGNITAIGTAIEGIEKHIAALINNFKGGGGSVQQFAAVALPLMGAFAGALAPLLSSLPVIGPLFLKLSGPIGIVAGLIGALVVSSPDLQKALVGAFTTIVGAVKTLAPVISNIVSIFSGLLVTVGNALAPVITALAQAFSQILVAIVPLIPPLLQLAVAIIQQILLPLLPSVVQLITLLANVFTMVMQALLPIVPQLTGFAMLLITAIAPILPQLAQLFIQLIMAIMPMLPPLLQLVMIILPPLISLLTVIANVISIQLVNALTVAVGVATDVIKVFADMEAHVASVLNAFINLLNQLRPIFSGIKNIAGDMVTTLINWFAALPGRVLSAVGSMGKTLYNAGKDTIQGFLNGAGSLIPTIGDWFLNKLPGWIRTPFKKALGIGSPSKVFAGFGTNVVEGLVNGISGSTDMVSSAMGDISSTVAGGLQLGTPTVTSSIGGSFVQTPAAAAAPQSKQTIIAQPAGQSGPMVQIDIHGDIINQTAEASDAFFDRLNRDAQFAELGVPI